jgi:hypothetical protein
MTATALQQPAQQPKPKPQRADWRVTAIMADGTRHTRVVSACGSGEAYAALTRMLPAGATPRLMGCVRISEPSGQLADDLPDTVPVPLDMHPAFNRRLAPLPGKQAISKTPASGGATAARRAVRFVLLAVVLIWAGTHLVGCGGGGDDPLPLCESRTQAATQNPPCEGMLIPVGAR